MFDTVLNLVVEVVPMLSGQLFRSITEPNPDPKAAPPTSTSNPCRCMVGEAPTTDDRLGG